MQNQNPLQDDYVRFPPSTRGGPEMAALTAEAAAKGLFKLSESEEFWRDIQPYLLSKGYLLRPRYTPSWTPAWVGTDIFADEFEDRIIASLPLIMDARRESDGMLVALKWIPNEAHTRDEVDVSRFVSSPELQADPRNHSNPLLDSFTHPEDSEGVFIVTPWLHDFYSIPILYVNELVDMMLQTFEGLAFLHEHHVAHRDCTHRNILQDSRPAFKRSLEPHPQRLGRAIDGKSKVEPLERYLCKPPVRYYFIDFGISTRFNGPGPYRVTGIIGRDPTAPELSETVPYDPFKLDVYILGNFYLQHYVQKYSNLEFLRPLLLRMTRQNPDNRPTMDEALRLLRRAARKPSGIYFRWRLRKRSDSVILALLALAQDIRSLGRELYFQAQGMFSDGRVLSFGRP